MIALVTEQAISNGGPRPDAAAEHVLEPGFAVPGARDGDPMAELGEYLADIADLSSPVESSDAAGSADAAQAPVEEPHAEAAPWGRDAADHQVMSALLQAHGQRLTAAADQFEACAAGLREAAANTEATHRQVELLTQELVHSRAESERAAAAGQAERAQLLEQVEALHARVRQADRDRDSAEAVTTATRQHVESLAGQLAKMRLEAERAATSVETEQANNAELTGAIQALTATLAETESARDAALERATLAETTEADTAQRLAVAERQLAQLTDEVQQWQSKLGAAAALLGPEESVSRDAEDVADAEDAEAAADA